MLGSPLQIIYQAIVFITIVLSVSALVIKLNDKLNAKYINIEEDIQNYGKLSTKLFWYSIAIGILQIVGLIPTLVWIMWILLFLDTSFTEYINLHWYDFSPIAISIILYVISYIIKKKRVRQ